MIHGQKLFGPEISWLNHETATHPKKTQKMHTEEVGHVEMIGGNHWITSSEHLETPYSVAPGSASSVGLGGQTWAPIGVFCYHAYVVERLV